MPIVPGMDYKAQAAQVLQRYGQALRLVRSATSPVFFQQAEERFQLVIDQAVALVAAAPVCDEHWYRTMALLADYRTQTQQPDVLETYGIDPWPSADLLTTRAVSHRRYGA